MDFVNRFVGSEHDRTMLVRAAQRYQQAVRLRANLNDSGDPLEQAGVAAEFRDALRALLNLGFPLDRVQSLYDEAAAGSSPRDEG